MNNMMPTDIDLSIIIVNYNGGTLFELCLKSLREHPCSRSIEVIVVDNASVDGSDQCVAAWYPEAIMLRESVNLGLAKAFNKGLARARGRYLLSLDNDTVVLPGALDALLDFMDTQPRAGVAGSRLLNPDRTLQQTARRFPHPLNALFGRRSALTRWFPGNPFSRRYLMVDEQNLQAPYKVDWVSTAALLVRREVVAQVRGLDEDFFVYWVDADWCYRIHLAGWDVYCVPSSDVVHNENLKAGRRDRRKTRMILDFHRGVYRYYRKHHARHWWNPMRGIAWAGLSLRACVLIAHDEVRRRAAARHGNVPTPAPPRR